MIDWHGAVLTYCKAAYGETRGISIQHHLWYLDNRTFFAMRGFTSLGHIKDSYPNTKINKRQYKYILNEMHDGVKALNEIIETATYLKIELEKETNNLIVKE